LAITETIQNDIFIYIPSEYIDPIYHCKGDEM